MMENKSMSFYIDRLIAVIQNIQTWVLAGFALPFIIQLAIDFFNIEVPDALLVLEYPIVLVPGLIALCLLISKWTDAGYKRVRKWQKNRVPPFKELTNNQQQFLNKIYRNNSRRFQVGDAENGRHWFQELKERKYIHLRSSGPIALNYEITLNGWKEIDRYESNRDATNG